MLIILFFVNHDMLLKVASLSKHLATYFAYIWLITSVMSLFSIHAVSLNIPLLIKQNSYYLTKRKIAKSTWEISLYTWEITLYTWEITLYTWEITLYTWEITLYTREIALYTWEITLYTWEITLYTWEIVKFSGKSHNYEKW